MKYFFGMLVLIGLFSSCGQNEVGCQSDSDCRVDRQCVQNICRYSDYVRPENNRTAENNGIPGENNGVTAKPTGTTNPPFCQNSADCGDNLVCRFRYGGLGCSIGVEGEIMVDFERNSDGCQATWSWPAFEGGRASYSCKTSTENLSECECEFESFGEPTEARFFVRQSLACSDPLEIENNINMFCGGNLDGTLNAHF